MMFSGKYQLIQHAKSIFIIPSDETIDYCDSDDLFKNAYYMIISKVVDTDVLFFESIINICQELDYYSLSILDENISEELMLTICRYCGKKFRNACPHLTVTVNIASRLSLTDNVFIGSLDIIDNVIFAQSFNGDTLKFSLFKTLKPEAARLYAELKRMDLNVLQMIVWIDNWFQKNIQYIQDHETKALGDVYVSPQINKQAVVTDVFMHHYGTCEDISVSIASILSLLEINYSILQKDGHAWLLINLDESYYVWDCTHNITRNRLKIENALQAGAYTYEYTLIGTDNHPEYNLINSRLYPTISSADYPRNKIVEAIKTLSDQKNVSFEYNKKPNYLSFIKSE